MLAGGFVFGGVGLLWEGRGIVRELGWVGYLSCSLHKNGKRRYDLEGFECSRVCVCLG